MAIFRLNYLNQVQIAANISSRNRTKAIIQRFPSNENWTLVDVYADEGITGTSADKRTEFKRLLSDCRKGLVDRVLGKSIM